MSYDVKLNLARGEYYSGLVTARFLVKSLPSRDIFIDFRGSKIDELSVNGDIVQPKAEDQPVFHDHRIRVPTDILRANQFNEIKVYFLNIYRTDGVGLTTFTEASEG